VEVRLATDGEILVRGPNVMLGYWRDEAATREAIVDGWLYTGDLGKFDADGNLRLVGRRKELLVLSTGKKVCPATVEQRLAGSPFVETACVVGDGRSHVGALIVPNPHALKKFIREKRLWVWSKHRAVTHPQVRELYRAEIDRVLADAAREEHVGPFKLLTRNFSLETGEVTAKFSLRREVIARNFASEIEAMYRD
jgi:long-chain acyl-CoA synthetase